MSFFDRLKYVEGAHPGMKRKPAGASSTSKAREEYEKKRKRSFQDHWKNDRAWLVFEEDAGTGKMHCSYCREYWGDKLDCLNAQAKLWVSGTTNFKVDSLKTHETSKAHIDSSRVSLGKNSTNTPASVAIRQLNAQHIQRLNIRFRNAHAVAKLDKSFKDYVWLCKLDKAKGLDIGNTYENDKAGRSFAHYISEVESNNTIVLLKKASFFSITIDGATDSGGMEQESVYVHVCVEGTKEQRFLQFIHPKSTSAQDIFKCITECLESFGIDPAKIVGITTDGASNMMGVRSGLCTLMKEISPNIIAIHCLAHRLELGVKDAVKSVGGKLYDRAMTMLIGLYYFYNKSPKQKEELKNTFKVLGTPCIIPTRVGGTRWVPHTMKAITIFRKSYKALTAQLDTASHKNAKAEGLAKLAHDSNIAAYLLMVRDVLTPVSKLSLYLQREDTTLGDALLMVSSTLDLMSPESIVISEELKVLRKENTFYGNALKGTATVQHDKLAAAVKQCLSKRFDSHREVVACTCCFTFSSWPDPNDKDAIIEFGNAEIGTLVDHFRLHITGERDEVTREWQLLKSLLYQRYGREMATVTWKGVHAAFKTHGVNNVLALADLVLSLPPTSVFNERSFSHMKLIKTDKRSRMSSKTLSEIMNIKVESPGIEEFDPTEAISLWMATASGRRRRPDFERHTNKQGTKQKDTTETVTEKHAETETVITETKSVPSAGGYRDVVETLESDELDNDSDSDSEIEQNELENENHITEIVYEIEREYN